MHADRYRAFRWLATVIVLALGLATIVAMATSNVPIARKVLGGAFVGLLVGGALVRIWMASRPYGRGDRD